MELSETYNIIKKSIVAFAPKYLPVKDKNEPSPQFFPIFGTGFIIHQDGLIVTNNHVVKVFNKLYKPPDKSKEEIPVETYLFRITGEGLLDIINLQVLGAFVISYYDPGPVYYGPPIPDIAIVQVKAKGLPVLEADESILEEGSEIATAGFPMGTKVLTAPGYLHQMAPTLQTGIISAVLPFTCKAPHAYAINIVTQSGASGSPVFLPKTGKVIGVLYAGLFDFGKTKKGDIYKIPTNISYVAPSRFIIGALEKSKKHPKFVLPEDTKSLDEIVRTTKSSYIMGQQRPYYPVKKIKLSKKLKRRLEEFKIDNENKPISESKI